VRSIAAVAVPFLIAVQDLPFSTRLLLIVVWVWVAMTVEHHFYGGSLFMSMLQRIEQWVRRSYIAAEIRNRKDGLESAGQRMMEDIQVELEGARLYDELGGDTSMFFTLLRVARYAASAALIGFVLVRPEVVQRIVDDVSAWASRVATALQGQL
jgi:hypothetical protein